MKKKLASGFVGEDPVVIVCVVHPENCWHVGPLDSYLADVAIAVENMALASRELAK